MEAQGVCHSGALPRSMCMLRQQAGHHLTVRISTASPFHAFYFLSLMSNTAVPKKNSRSFQFDCLLSFLEQNHSFPLRNVKCFFFCTA